MSVWQESKILRVYSCFFKFVCFGLNFKKSGQSCKDKTEC